MSALYYLIPIALLLGAIGLGAFLWSLQTGQYEDLQGEAHRALHDDPPVTREQARLRRAAHKE